MKKPPPARTIRLLLVDDHPLVREGIRACLSRQKGLQVAGEAADGQEALAQFKRLAPDVVLMDISMPGMNGLEAARRMRQADPGARILLLTMHENTAYLRDAFRAGVRGYVVKDAAPRELLQAIQVVHAGGRYTSGESGQALLDEILTGKETAPERSPLTRRERDVLAHIADGLGNKEIAQRLALSVRTIESHRRSLMEKLQIHSTAGLTKYAVSQGLSQLQNPAP